MARSNRNVLSLALGASGWLSSVFPGAWAAVTASAGALVLVLLGAGAKAFANPEVVGGVFLFVLFLWTFVGLTWLATRKPRDARALRYAITFEGVFPNLDMNNPDGALQFSVALRNYSPAPIKYSVDKFELLLDTRTLPSRYVSGTLGGVLQRGAGKTSSLVPFKLEHIKEFFGKRIEGQIDLSVKYGDADRAFVRRFSVSIRLYLAFPNEDDAQPKFGHNHNVLEENDEPL